MRVRYSARRLAQLGDEAFGGKYVFVSREVDVVGVWLSEEFYAAIRKMMSEEDPRLEFVGVDYLSRLYPNPLCKLTSSHGEVTFDTSTGVVVKVEEETDEPGCLECIYRVDVDNLRLLIPDLDARTEVDILDAGFWYTTDRGSTAFEPPEPDHAAWTAGKREFPWADTEEPASAHT